MQSIVMQDEEAGLSVNQSRIEMFSRRAKDRRLPSLDPDRRYFPSVARQIIYHHCAPRCGTTNLLFFLSQILPPVETIIAGTRSQPGNTPHKAGDHHPEFPPLMLLTKTRGTIVHPVLGTELKGTY